MPCYRPLRGWRSRSSNPSGKRSIVFKKQHGYEDQEIELPCGQCIGCRLERARQWAIRCVHEASLYEDNCVLTLTYDDEHLPSDGSLNVRDIQLFMKRLRKRFGAGIRFFQCGEYGDNLGRPHHHAIIFNFDFPDKKYLKNSPTGDKLYHSDILSTGTDEVPPLWPHGYALIGSLTFESCAYVARYITKKIGGDRAEDHYNGLKPEFITMSRNPGIGKGWYEKYKDDLNGDFVVINGKRMSVPKFYDGFLELDDIESYYDLKKNRKAEAEKHAENNTLRRLRDREEVKLQQTRSLHRNLEREGN